MAAEKLHTIYMLRRASKDVDGSANWVESVTIVPPTAALGLRLNVAEPAPGVRLIIVAGELDILSAPMLEESVHRQLGSDLRALIINLTDLRFLGCAGILVLVNAQEAAQRMNVPLLLVCASRAVLRILKIGDVLDRFAISPTLGDALSRVR